jgi:hypothetical protein
LCRFEAAAAAAAAAAAMQRAVTASSHRNATQHNDKGTFFRYITTLWWLEKSVGNLLTPTNKLNTLLTKCVLWKFTAIFTHFLKP